MRYFKPFLRMTSARWTKRAASTVALARAPVSNATKFVPIAPFVAAIAFSQVNASQNSAPPKESADSIRAEELYNDAKVDRRKLLEELQKMHDSNPEDIHVLWRLIRAAYDVAMGPKTSKDEKKQLLYYCRDLADEGLKLREDMAEIHNWYGIVLSAVGDFEGTKEAIANSYIIKEHWERALELNPRHPTPYHCLGRWCMTVADLSWLERKAAALLFGTPPESSYEEALEYLLQCDKLCASSWKKNSLLLAQVYQRLGDKDSVRYWARQATIGTALSNEDRQAQAEATALLKTLVT